MRHPLISILRGGGFWSLVCFLVLGFSAFSSKACVSEICPPGDFASDLRLNPDLSPCTKNCECNNQLYVGECVQGVCRARERGICQVVGELRDCYGFISRCKGTQVCQPKYLKDRYWGNCSCIAVEEPIPDGGRDASPDRVVEKSKLHCSLQDRRSERNGESIKVLRYSPDGRFVGVGSTPKKGLTVFDAKTRSKWMELPETPGLKTVHSMSFAPDGKSLAVGYGSGEIEIWGLENRKLLKALNVGNADVQVLQFSPDGRWLVGASGSRLVGWEVTKSYEPLSISSLHSASIVGITFRPKTSIFASISSDKLIVLWDLSTSKLSAQLEGNTEHTTLAFHPGGETLLVGQQTGIISLWDLQKKEVLKKLPAHSSTVSSLMYHPSGKFFVSTSPTLVKFWDEAGVSQEAPFSSQTVEKAARAVFSPDGAELWVAGYNGVLYRFSCSLL